MDWFPIVFVIFKLLVLGTGMFFAVKWHYEQGKKENGKAKRAAVLRATAKAVAAFVLALLGLALFTFVLVRVFHLDLPFSFP
ncbi:hypothetical protein RD110_15290 [Rhodoferax koreense]|uniref:Uncharacterized protein n=1 Tax=Rhodoferax koreensis TaxID=1842727 RepID=A0A1P8JXA3_9BURK|nr:hypothetical protein [Rhodoferax koreense]APW38389.1 hypothetical protein RD110_15290 [Rhodoferax koreense]